MSRYCSGSRGGGGGRKGREGKETEEEKWRESLNLTDLTRVHQEVLPSSPPLGGHTVRLEENPGSCTSC